MEGMVTGRKGMFGGAYAGTRVLVTGHSGFKGSWLALWLQGLGARVVGVSLEPETSPSHYRLLSLDCESRWADVREREALGAVMKEYRPEVVFHLAAQALVRRSYRNPVETFETNVIGTVNVLDACRSAESVRAVVNVTSDKCYENREWVWGYRESDPVGGHDPYSASKGCAELVTESFRRSFFSGACPESVLLCSARAGNVIGGGDWAEDRLVPDMVRGVSRGERVVLRNPGAIRPWQHVLEPLSGYLLLGQRLLEGCTECCGAWNFGPGHGGHRPVVQVADALHAHWDAIEFERGREPGDAHEAHILKLDCTKARTGLGWAPVWQWETACRKTAEWYRAFCGEGRVISREQLEAYTTDARSLGMVWAGT